MDETRLDPETAGRIRSWCGERPLRLCVVFGSRARETAGPDSDLDLALWPERDVTPSELLGWQRELSRLSDCDVQVALVTPELDPVLAMQIAREGRPVFEPSSDDWLSARVRLWQSYQDALPFLRAERERLKRYAGDIRGS